MIDDNRSSLGYVDCSCLDCFNICISAARVEKTFCYECKKAGCPDYQDVPGMSQECRADGAYGDDDDDCDEDCDWCE